MATHDVPGANPANADELAALNWAEHKDGTLLFVKGTEGGKIVFDIFDLAREPVMYYTDAMPELRFKKYFNHGPAGTRKDEWTWHDKTTFPWDRVMKRLGRPQPQHADVADQLTAAERVARDLGKRGRELTEEDVAHFTPREYPASRGVMRRLRDAMDAFRG